MEVKAGYKQTEVGMIPEDWSKKSITDLVDVIDGDRGINYPKDSDFSPSGYCLFLSAENVTKNGFKFNKCLFITKEKNNSLTKGSLKKWDIVLTTRGTVGNIAFFDKSIPYENIQINSGMVILRKKNVNVNMQYLYKIFQSRIIGYQIDRVAFGSAQPQLTVGIINAFQIPFAVSLPEQRAIATALSDADAHISSLEQIIAKKHDIKQVVRQNLLTNGIGHTEFKETRIGRIPLEWEIKPLEKLAEVKGRIGWRGYTIADLRNSGPISLGAENISKENSLDLTNLTHISKEKYDESPEITIKKNDVLVVQRGSIGKVAIVDKDLGEATINSSMILIKNICIDPWFLYCWLCGDLSQKNIFNSIAQTGVPMISQGQVRKFQIVIPPPQEQHAIATVLSDMDAELAALEQKRDKTKAIKQGMMQELLTGRIRLT